MRDYLLGGDSRQMVVGVRHRKRRVVDLEARPVLLGDARRDEVCELCDRNLIQRHLNGVFALESAQLREEGISALRQNGGGVPTVPHVPVVACAEAEVLDGRFVHLELSQGVEGVLVHAGPPLPQYRLRVDGAALDQGRLKVLVELTIGGCLELLGVVWV